jgi:hypothetical protein
LSNEQKLRLTKNHIHKIIRGYVNNIVSQAPGVVPVPNNPKERQDQKAAELNKSVWQFAKVNHRLNIQIQKWAKDYCEIGEVILKVFFDPAAGRFVGYEQELDEMGQPVFDENGQPQASDRASFTGDLMFERIHGFNLLRAPEAKTMDESPYFINRKMVAVDDLKKMVQGDEDKEKLVVESMDETYYVFDNNKSRYVESKNQAMVKEFYFRPCLQYPSGYFYIATGKGILFEGELPFGIFPIIYEGFDEVSTTPRHRSIIKQLRPYQVEINRAGSKMAEHQVTLGDDKVILQNGSKVTSGPHLPGIRTMYVNGSAPTVMAGRTGEQYMPYVDSQIKEIYQVANMVEDYEEKDSVQDPYARLYTSIKNRKKFKIYTDKFEDFLCRVCKTYLELAKQYFDENTLIPMIGRSEYVNIPEFKSIDPLNFQIKIEPMSDDIETMMGKHLVFNHLLQYVGPNLEKTDVGRIMKNMPFMNGEAAFKNLTINEDSADNIILALERGDAVQLQRYDDVEFIGKQLSSRMKEADFQLLSPQIQMQYQDIVDQCENIAAERLAAIKAGQSEFIPSGGMLTKCDFYVPDPSNTGRTTRATVPSEALDWLIKKLAEQGSAQEILMRQEQGVQADIARKLVGQINPQVPGGPNGQMNLPGEIMQ